MLFRSARLGFAIAAFLEPSVLVVDEVLAVGDQLFQQKCLDRMRTVLQSGTTLLLVSHDLAAVGASLAELLPHVKRAMPEAQVVVELGRYLVGEAGVYVCRVVDRKESRGQVFLVTVHAPVRWKRADNDVIRRCAASYDDGHVHVVDWDAAASAHPAWLYADHTHLRPAGARAYADLLATAVTSTHH